MAQKWYKKASVQAAIIGGVFLIVAAIIGGLFGLYQGLFTPSPKTPSIIIKDLNSQITNYPASEGKPSSNISTKPSLEPNNKNIQETPNDETNKMPEKPLEGMIIRLVYEDLVNPEDAKKLRSFQNTLTILGVKMISIVNKHNESSVYYYRVLCKNSHIFKIAKSSLGEILKNYDFQVESRIGDLDIVIWYGYSIQATSISKLEKKDLEINSLSRKSSNTIPILNSGYFMGSHLHMSFEMLNDI